MNYGKNKIVLILFLLFINKLFCIDIVKDSCDGGSLTYRIFDAEQVYTSGNTTWVRASDFQYTWDYDPYTKSGWSSSWKEQTEDGARTKYRVQFTQLWWSCSASIEHWTYFDNSASFPTISFPGASYKAGKYYSSQTTNFNVTVPADSGCGTETVVYSVDGVAGPAQSIASDGTCNFEKTVSGEGLHTISVTVTDRVGNISTRKKILVIDLTPPAITGVEDTANGDWVHNARVSATASDDLSGINTSSWQYSINKGVSFSSSSSINNSVTLSADGIYYVIFKVADYVGRTVTSSSQMKTVRIDNSAPLITVTDSSAGKWVSAATVSATAIDPTANGVNLSGIDNNTWQYSTNGGTTWASGKIVTLSSSGTYSVMFRVMDNAGNTATSAPKTIRVDAVAPVISVNNPAGTGWVSSATVSAIGTDTLSGINTSTWQYSFNKGSSWSAPSSSNSSVTLSSNGVENKPYLVRFKVLDNAGNDTESPDVAVRIDTSIPAITISGLPSPYTAPFCQHTF